MTGLLYFLLIEGGHLMKLFTRMLFPSCVFLLSACGGSGRGGDPGEPTGIFVNDEELTSRTVDLIERDHGIRVTRAQLDQATLDLIDDIYGVRISEDQFWYDPVSGLWGFTGLFSLGRIAASIDMGGPLREDASGGKTDVFVNGRRIHPVELTYLESQFGPITPTRYFLLASGEYGFEGGPVRGSLWSPPSPSGGPSGGAVHSEYGTVYDSGDVIGFVDGDTGFTCGPDGGCIF